VAVKVADSRSANTKTGGIRELEGHQQIGVFGKCVLVFSHQVVGFPIRPGGPKHFIYIQSFCLLIRLRKTHQFQEAKARYVFQEIIPIYETVL
jgi:hypothetical protein